MINHSNVPFNQTEDATSLQKGYKIIGVPWMKPNGIYIYLLDIRTLQGFPTLQATERNA